MYLPGDLTSQVKLLGTFEASLEFPGFFNGMPFCIGTSRLYNIFQPIHHLLLDLGIRSSTED
jgi:hypothetical protein